MMYTFGELVDIVARLRSDQGCPWDREQTFASLKPYLLEEAGEVIRAVDLQDMDNLCEELGDLLFHVLIYSQIGAETGCFRLEDVIDGICRKMIRRHPYVFGENKDLPPESWEEIKKREKAEKP